MYLVDCLMLKIGLFSSVRIKFYIGMMTLVVITQFINGMTLINTREKEIASEVLFNAMLFAEYNSEEIVEYYDKTDDQYQSKLFKLIGDINKKNHDLEGIYVIDNQNRIVVSPRSYNQNIPLKDNHELASSDLIQRMNSLSVSTQSTTYNGRNVLDVLYPMEGEYDGKDYFVRFLFNYHNQEASVFQMKKQMLFNGFTSIVVGMLLIIVISNYFTRPIRKLVHHAKLISKGDFSSAISISSRDELGTLFRAFNTMQTELNRSFSELIAAKDELSRLNISLERRVKERTQELNERNEQLEILSITDKLTGCYNRLKLDSLLESEHEKFEQCSKEFGVIMIDLDFFKQVNDNYGHAIGDSVLKESAKIIRNSVREMDIVGRWGGEEFMIICPNTNETQAVALAERVRKSISQYDFEHTGQRTASLGVSIVKTSDTFETLNSRADSALYEAKKNGRNKVVVSN